VKRAAAFSILLTLVIIFTLGYLSIEFLGAYGWTIFLFAPFLIGFLPGFITSKKVKISKIRTYQLGYVGIAFAILILLAFGIEGAICLVMALPIFIASSMAGSFIAYRITTRKFGDPMAISLLLVIFSLSFLSFDYSNKAEKLISVKTTVEVDAPPSVVWDNVVTFDTIPEPKNWIFKTGIAYPTHASIDGSGVGAIRKCNFTTGSFVEPITTWDEPNVLEFGVTKQPAPMTEVNPFWNKIAPAHLDGYFRTYKGSFKLTPLENGKTLLQGTTYYRVDIQPEFYWKLWSNFIIHRIHQRVLTHIKNESEAM
jgi:uncharacterized membrane protein